MSGRKPFVAVYNTFPNDPAEDKHWLEACRKVDTEGGEPGVAFILHCPPGITHTRITAALEAAGLRGGA